MLFFNPLAEKLKMYYVTGGMPEVVSRWEETQSVGQVQQVLMDIIQAYERDFMKHPAPREYPKIGRVWNSLPSQLARENKKFLYNVIKEGARAREYEDALEWLVHAALVYKVFRITSPGLPLSAYEDLSAFKIYLTDVGVLRRLSKLDPVAFREGNRLFTEFKGALTENFILQSLVPQFDAMPHYWSRINPPYEMDFIIQRKNDIIPVEVKADTNIKSRSLKKYAETFEQETKLRVRFSMNNLRMDEGVLNIPLFMADQADRLIGIALGETHESKRAERVGKTLIQSQSSIWHKNTCASRTLRLDPCFPQGGNRPHGGPSFKLYSSRGCLWASPFFHTILSEFPLTGRAPYAPLCI